MNTHSVYVLTKGGLTAVGQVSVDDEVPQRAPNDDDCQVEQDQQLKVVGAALQPFARCLNIRNRWFLQLL